MSQLHLSPPDAPRPVPQAFCTSAYEKSRHHVDRERVLAAIRTIRSSLAKAALPLEPVELPLVKTP